MTRNQYQPETKVQPHRDVIRTNLSPWGQRQGCNQSTRKSAMLNDTHHWRIGLINLNLTWVEIGFIIETLLARVAVTEGSSRADDLVPCAKFCYF